MLVEWGCLRVYRIWEPLSVQESVDFPNHRSSEAACPASIWRDHLQHRTNKEHSTASGCGAQGTGRRSQCFNWPPRQRLGDAAFLVQKRQVARWVSSCPNPRPKNLRFCSSVMPAGRFFIAVSSLGINRDTFLRVYRRTCGALAVASAILLPRHSTLPGSDATGSGIAMKMSEGVCEQVDPASSPCGPSQTSATAKPRHFLGGVWPVMVGRREWRWETPVARVGIC